MRKPYPERQPHAFCKDGSRDHRVDGDYSVWNLHSFLDEDTTKDRRKAAIPERTEPRRPKCFP